MHKRIVFYAVGAEVELLRRCLMGIGYTEFLLKAEILGTLALVLIHVKADM
jgi:hypothetical protein